MYIIYIYIHIYIVITDSCCTAETNVALQSNYPPAKK